MDEKEKKLSVEIEENKEEYRRKIKTKSWKVKGGGM